MRRLNVNGCIENQLDKENAIFVGDIMITQTSCPCCDGTLVKITQEDVKTQSDDGSYVISNIIRTERIK